MLGSCIRLLLCSALFCLQFTFAQTSNGEKKFTHADSLRGSLSKARTWWDVLHYTILVEPDYAQKTISGKVDIQFKAIAAHSLVVRVDEPTWATVDRALLEQLEQALRHGGPQTQQLWPVPVMGIPGWSPAQAQGNFYSDASVFRPSVSQAGVGRTRRGNLETNLVAKASADTMSP